MRNVLTALAAGPGAQFWPVRQLHQSIANDVWLVRRTKGQPAVMRLSRTAAASLDLQREANYLRQLLHPALPQVLAAFPTPQGFCLVTTAFDGVSLATVLQRSGRPLPPGLVLSWAEDACATLDYLHNGPLPLIHRDVHPGHLIVQVAPAGGRPGSLGLIDFGAAVQLSDTSADDRSTLSALGTARLGHLEYAAPEQLLAVAAAPDPRTDVYGIAAAMYRLLTGHGPARPFEFAPAATVNPAVPPAVNTILQRALSPDLSSRYESAAALAEDIANLRVSMHPFAAPARSGLATLLTEVELSAEERAALQDPVPGMPHDPPRDTGAAAPASASATAPASASATTAAAPAAAPHAAPPAPAHTSPAADTAAAAEASPEPPTPAKTAAARVLADVTTTRPARQAATAVTASNAPMDTPLPPRRRRPRRRTISLAWLLLPILTAAGVWAVLHFSGIM